MKRPWWITALILVITAAAIALPLLLANTHATETSAETSWLIKLYPVYGAAAGLCAWLCWPTRKEVTWILLVLLALCAGGICIII